MYYFFLPLFVLFSTFLVTFLVFLNHFPLPFPSPRPYSYFLSPCCWFYRVTRLRIRLHVSQWCALASIGVMKQKRMRKKKISPFDFHKHGGSWHGLQQSVFSLIHFCFALINKWFYISSICFFLIIQSMIFTIVITIFPIHIIVNSSLLLSYFLSSNLIVRPTFLFVFALYIRLHVAASPTLPTPFFNGFRLFLPINPSLSRPLPLTLLPHSLTR